VRRLSFPGILQARRSLVWRTIHWPVELDPERAVAVLRQIGTDQYVPTVAFEVEAAAGTVVHRLGTAPAAADRVEQLFAALISDAAITQSKSREFVRASWRVVLTTKHRPLQAADPKRVTRALLAALTSTERKERVVVQWLLGPTRSPRVVSSAEPSTTAEPWWRPLVSGETQLDPERRRALEAKRGEHAFACIGRVGIEASTPARTRALAVALLAALRTAEAPGVGIKLVKEPSGHFNDVAPPWFWPYSLNLLELVGLLGWPLGDESLPGLSRDVSRWFRPDPRIRPHGRVLGVATAPGERREIGLSIDDARQHLHVIGPTGTGKSTLLANLALADISVGRSVVLIEPKGDVVADVLARVPHERVADVVVVDPAEPRLPIGLNPLAAHGRSPELVADQVLAVFRGLSESWGPRLEVVMHAALLTLARRNDASLCALPALLTNPTVRGRLRAGTDDVALDQFWGWFEALSPGEQQQVVAPVLTRLQPVLLRPAVRTMVGQLAPRFRVEDIFRKRRIVLVALRRGVIGPEAAALLGSLFVAELWQAVLGRTAIAPERRHTVAVYADEFQDYVHLPTDMSDALAQARGLGVALSVGHQHLGQLPAGSLRAAVLANARSRVCFQLAGDDAQTMARLSGGQLEAQDFQRLPRFAAYAQLVVGGEVTEFTSLRTMPLSRPVVDAQLVRDASRSSYGRPVDEVEAEIRRLLEGEPEQSGAVGRRPRSER
jgi:hypothetical protein